MARVLTHTGVTYSSPNPIEAVRAMWQGSEHNALRFTHDILFGPIAIRVPVRMPSVTLQVVAQGALVASGYWMQKLADSAAVAAGERTIVLSEPDGIDTIMLFTAAELTLISIVVRLSSEPIGELVYDTYHHRANTRSTVPASELEEPVVLASVTGLDEHGALQAHQSSVGLRWNRREAGGAYLRADAPVLVQVRRADLAEDGVTVLRTAILNEAAPALVSQRREPASGGPGPELPHYADRSLPDGHYAYAARGIDIFGVLSDWGPAQTVDVLDRRAPPPPQAVRASYLDPLDPWLSQADTDWANANGPGLKLAWEWPGIFRLQAPDVVPPLAEFRIYATLGGLNILAGSVTQVAVRGDESELATDMRLPDGLGREWIRVGQHFFQILANSGGANGSITVANLAAPRRVPQPGSCSITFGLRRDYWSDYGEATSWQRRVHVEAAAAIPLVSAQVTGVAAFDAADDPAAVIARAGATRTVTTDGALADADGVLLPGALLCEGVVYRAYGHTLGNTLKIHIVPAISPTDSSLVEPPAGAPCAYYPGRRYEVRIAGLELLVPPGQATAQAHVALSTSDGAAHTADDPVWAQPGRGGLGGRPGNESALSPASQIVAVRRTQPAVVGNVPRATDAPIFARPANYYGQARYTLSWEVVTGADGYAVYRCSGVALFEQDRAQRQAQTGYYASGGVFGDDAGYAAWLASFDPSLSEAEMLAQPDAHRDAWRSWAGRFYSTRTDAQLQALADREGNQAAFRRLNADTVSATSYDDTFDGRGRGCYLYRIRTLDAAGNLSEWSATFPPVHIFDVTPPATPSIEAVTSGENSITIQWKRGSEADIAEYRIWRGESSAALADLRRVAPTAIVPAEAGTTVLFTDHGLVGLRTYHYRVAAVDTRGNLSVASATLSAWAVDTTPPEPPPITSLEWVRVDRSGHEFPATGPAPDGKSLSFAVKVEWQGSSDSSAMVQFRNSSMPDFANASTWLVGGTAVYVHKNSLSYLEQEYRILIRGSNGMFNQTFEERVLPALG